MAGGRMPADIIDSAPPPGQARGTHTLVTHTAHNYTYRAVHVGAGHTSHGLAARALSPVRPRCALPPNVQSSQAEWHKQVGRGSGPTCARRL
eukprot:4653422-Prymnesium_polylepis.2